MLQRTRGPICSIAQIAIDLISRNEVLGYFVPQRVRRARGRPPNASFPFPFACPKMSERPWKLDPKMSERYSRQMLVHGALAQGKLREASVLVVGAGALGCACLPYLVGSGVGRVTVCDGDTVETNNLHRQTLFLESDAGKDALKQLSKFKKKQAKAKSKKAVKKSKDKPEGQISTEMDSK